MRLRARWIAIVTMLVVTASSSLSEPARAAGVAPQMDLPGWNHLFFDDFDKPAPPGSWRNDCDAGRVVYQGQQGQQWLTYPRCFTDTFDKRPYRADEVLQVSGGNLIFDLHSVDGQPAGANPSPIIGPGGQYQRYGRYSVRMRAEPGLYEYYVAWLLWPESERWPGDGEFDFPEGYLTGTVGGWQHFASEGACDGCKFPAVDIGARFTDWHVYTIEWSPGRVRYLLDDVVVLDSTQWVSDTPMRWQLQTETRGNGANRGQVLVDWVSVWSYAG